MAVAAEALWKHKPTKPISSKVPYYLFVFFFLLVVMSIVLLAETQGLLQQLQNDLVIWSEAHQEKWATSDHDCSPNHYTKKKNPPHASYTARARAAWRAIYKITMGETSY